MTAEEEERQKQELIEQERGDMTQKIEQMLLLQKFSVTQTAIEQEYITDNNARLKQMHGKVSKSVQKKTEANEKFEELNPKMEAIVESLAEQPALSAESVVEGIIVNGPMGEFGRKIIKYQAKEMAIQDAIMVIRDCPLSVEETQNEIRNLARSQFKNRWKANRLIQYCAANRF